MYYTISYVPGILHIHARPHFTYQYCAYPGQVTCIINSVYCFLWANARKGDPSTVPRKRAAHQRNTPCCPLGPVRGVDWPIWLRFVLLSFITSSLLRWGVTACWRFSYCFLVGYSPGQSPPNRPRNARHHTSNFVN